MIPDTGCAGRGVAQAIPGFEAAPFNGADSDDRQTANTTAAQSQPTRPFGMIGSEPFSTLDSDGLQAL